MTIKNIDPHAESFPHGVMFHHFHNEKHPKSQGSISAIQFDNMLTWLTDRKNVLSADEFSYKLKLQKLDNTDICITFDDALLCQYEIALPILKARGIQAYFFIYSSPFHKDPDLLEVFRIFRNSSFGGIDNFYKQFSDTVANNYSQIYSKAEINFKKIDYLNEYQFYTENDKWFRFLRDHALCKEQYLDVMNTLMREKNFSVKDAQKTIWITRENLFELANGGHTIGLHSYSHPVSFQLLDKETQELEYQKNFDHLKEITGLSPTSMSHPFGNYNQITLDILKSMKIEIGFRDNSSIKEIRSIYEVPRKDHANILQEMLK